MLSKLSFLLTFLICINSLESQEINKDIFKAMNEEIQRSMQDLKIGDIKAPYFIEYKLEFRNSYKIKSVLGSIIESNNTKNAALTVGIRIGDYKFDNTNFFDIGLNFFGSSDDEESFKNRNIPYEIDYNNLKRELWLATDAAYKQAVEIYTKKESTLKNRMRKDTTYDFTRFTPQKSYSIAKSSVFDVKNFETIANLLSDKFNKFPQIFASSVNIEYLPETTYYLNSEGMEYAKNDLFTGIEITAFTQAIDGMGLTNFYSAYSKEPSNLPDADSLSKSTDALINNLVKMLKAPELEDPYSGPILFSGQAAAEVFAQSFAPNLVAQRNQMTEGGAQQNNANLLFQNKIGGRVLPEFISVIDTPDKSTFKNTQTIGSYRLDDDGILPLEVKLVENGFLKGLLSDRVPTRRIRESNGHKRGGSAMYSVLELNALNTKIWSYDSLKSFMIKLCKDREIPFGIVVKKLVNQNILYTSLYRIASGNLNMPRGNGSLSVIESYKVFPDGREELIKSAEANGVVATLFKDIIAVGNSKYALNLLAPAAISPFSSGGDQYIGSTVIVPDLLFEDAELKSIEDDFKKLPILSNPIK